MPPRETVSIVGVVAVLHVGLMITLFIIRMSCGIKPDCANCAVDILRDVLAFPLNLVTLILDSMGVDSDEVVRRYLHPDPNDPGTLIEATP